MLNYYQKSNTDKTRGIKQNYIKKWAIYYPLRKKIQKQYILNGVTSLTL